MQKHIEKLENLSCANIDNLTIDKLGHFNLFSGKISNGHKDIGGVIYKQLVKNDINGFSIIPDIFSFKHYTDLKSCFIEYFKENRQIFATTQRYDVIQAFAEVAQEFKDVEAYYYRLGRSAIPSDNNKSIVSMYTIDELIEATSKNREVR